LVVLVSWADAVRKAPRPMSRACHFMDLLILA
jgi:hypothetical protein